MAEPAVGADREDRGADCMKLLFECGERLKLGRADEREVGRVEKSSQSPRTSSGVTVTGSSSQRR
jgi:hypothetical protein